MMLVPRKKDFDLLDNMFNDAFFDFNDSKVMKTDIKEHEKSFELLMDLPGYNKEDIKMNIEDGYLVINAKTSSDNEEKDKKGRFVRKERYYGECSRSFYVGEGITEEEISAKFKNGTLRIEIPKKDEHKQIEQKKYIEIDED